MGDGRQISLTADHTASKIGTLAEGRDQYWDFVFRCSEVFLEGYFYNSGYTLSKKKREDPRTHISKLIQGTTILKPLISISWSINPNTAESSFLYKI
jgi:hypothetical protein